ncbi:hypothetical protein D4R42_01945 [bacterium]|nr:MAG: hypothetical protein D4R42_01945 [bacterium]
MNFKNKWVLVAIAIVVIAIIVIIARNSSTPVEVPTTTTIEEVVDETLPMDDVIIDMDVEDVVAPMEVPTE